MTLARRVWLASVALAFIVVAAFVALIFAISAQRDATAREARSADVTAASLRLEKLVVDMETGIRGLTLTGEEPFLEPYTSAIRALPAQRAALQALVADDPVQRRRAQQVEESIREYVEFAGPLVQLVKETPSIGEEPLVAEEGKRLTDDIQDVFDRLLSAEDALAADAGRDAERRSNLAVIVGAIGIGASTALIILFGVFLARSIGRPVRAVASGATRLAAGELSLRLPPQGPGEIGELTRAFNDMAERIEQNHAELEAQNAELRESERMKTELVSIVSHELRTPLASVLGFTALLLKREFDPPIRRHYLGIVDAQARRLAALLEDFLDVQRIEHQGLELSTERVDLATLLDEQAELYAEQSPRHTVEVALKERPLSVRGDPAPAGTGRRQPALERDQVLAGRRDGPARGRAKWLGRARGRPRRRGRDPRRPAGTHLHEVLPRRRRRNGNHRHRPRSGGLARDRRGARRQHRFRQRSFDGIHLLGRAAGGTWGRKREQLEGDEST